MMGEMTKSCRILSGKPEGETPLGKPMCRWEDNIKMNLKNKGEKDVNWIYLTQVMTEQ
jgi:hypothetical protein